jgi:penicillin V acylase-like amidase (Ntn superfamily)
MAFFYLMISDGLNQRDLAGLLLWLAKMEYPQVSAHPGQRVRDRLEPKRRHARDGHQARPGVRVVIPCQVTKIKENGMCTTLTYSDTNGAIYLGRTMELDVEEPYVLAYVPTGQSFESEVPGQQPITYTVKHRFLAGCRAGDIRRAADEAERSEGPPGPQ